MTEKPDLSTIYILLSCIYGGRPGEIVKVYLYDEENLVYTKATYASFSPVDGQLLKPENSTILPPPDVAPGYIRVFDIEAKKWKVVFDPDNKIAKHPIFINVRVGYAIDQVGLKRKRLNILAPPSHDAADPDSCSFYQLGDVAGNFKKYANPNRISMDLKYRIHYLDACVREIFQLFEENGKSCSGGPRDLDVVYASQYAMEGIIYQMKRILDLYICLLSIGLTSGKFDLESTILVDSVGALFDSLGNSAKQLQAKLRDALKFDKYSDLLFFINDLNNAYKHDILTGPNIDLSYFSPVIDIQRFFRARKNLKEVVNYVVPLNAIVFAFGDFVNDVILGRRVDNAGKFFLSLPQGITDWFCLKNLLQSLQDS